MAVGATDGFDSAMYGAAGGFVVGGLICGLSDTDADGVKNFMDKCPGTAAGATVDENGCEKAGAAEVGDSDGDGVSDDRDRCPGTPAGAKVDEYGCELDEDGDGVVNSKDKCPGTPPGVAVDNNGCTLEEKYALKNVNFAFDRKGLTSIKINSGKVYADACLATERPGCRVGKQINFPRQQSLKSVWRG